MHTVTVPGPAPHGVVADRLLPVAYVTYEGATDGPGGVTGIDLETGNVLWTTPAGVYTLGVTALTR